MEKMKFQKPLVVMLAAVLAISLFAGCSGSEEASNEGANEPAGTEGTAVLEGDMSTWPDAEFSVLLGWPDHQTAADDAPILKQVYDLTKVRLKLEVPPTNVDEKLNILLASGEYPDVMVIANPTIAQKFIDGGHVIPLDDLIDKYGGQLKANLGEDLDKLRSEDGKIYKIPPGYIMPGAERMLEAGNSFQFLTNVLEEKGWYKPTTFDDIYALLKEVKETYPQYVPMSLALGDENFFNTMVATLGGAEGVRVLGDYVWTKDDKLIYKFKDESIRHALQWLNRLYQEGLIDKESPVQNKDALQAKMASEKVFSSIGHWFDTMYEANSIFNQNGKPFRFKYFLPKAGDHVEKTTYIGYGTSYDAGTYITKKMADPVRFMQFVNWLNTYDGNLAQLGIINYDGEDKEGYDFYIGEDNGQQTLEITTYQINGWQTDELFAAKRGYGHFGYLTFSTDMNEHPSYRYKTARAQLDFSIWWDEEQKRINEGFGESGTDWIEEGRSTSWDFSDVAGLVLKPESDEFVAMTKINQLAYNEMVKLIVSSSDDQFNQGYDAFLAKIEGMGIGQAEATINRMYEDRKKLWN
ncbi:ABC transporter substrate-binding protein [Paenibacillus cisolokensis]|uniref:ABC transporter substrate-binding protein n=1 Tax=Paenibacillus cisolokensis TaxID=1658519 RepID=A0ABQ4N1L1_9BACL|nr:extracellular solute-binding protein [Paenibacillus cisolokensis]GIQ62066.1 ABC transporter substrate-binding protein [Paenibacillus cisolokensis]